MNKFDSIVDSNLREPIVVLSEDDLAPDVFIIRQQAYPVLRENVKVQILNDIDQIRKVAPVVEFFLVGDILSKNYTATTDVDVIVRIDAEETSSVSAGDVLHLLKQLNGRLVSSTRRKLNYYVTPNTINADKLEAVYDIINDKWVKTPRIRDQLIISWINKLSETVASIDIGSGLPLRDLIDVDELNGLNTNGVKILRKSVLLKVDQLKSLLNQNVNIVKMVIDQQFDDPQDLVKFCNDYNIPDNILVKMLELLYYKQFADKLTSILSDRDELELTDQPKLRRIIGNLWKS